MVRLAVLLPLFLSACLASSVIDESERVRVAPSEAIHFLPGAPERIDGLWESVAIQGEAAAALMKLYYDFEPGGRYSGAALLLESSGPVFRTIQGTWALDEDRLVLDGGAPAVLAHADGLLRLSSETGTVVLRSVALQ